MEDRNYDEILDIKDILNILLAKKWVILFVALFGFVFAFVYTKLFIPYQFTADVSIYVKNATNNTAVDVVNQADINAAKQLATTCIEILSDDVVVDNIGEKLLEDYSAEELSEYFTFEETADGNVVIKTESISQKVSYSTVNDTELIRITVTCGDPVIAADMCNYITEIAPDILIRVVGAGAAEAVGQAKVPTEPSLPSVRKNASIGFIAGLILAMAFIVIRYMLDNTIKSGDDAVEKFDLPLIGEIPFYSFGNNVKNNKKDGLLVKLKLKKKVVTNDKERKTMLDVEVPFAVKEAYNTMRNNLIFSLSTGKDNVFVVSSALPGEGKSTSVANMCISIGETESKVLLVDADIRKPVQHKMFELDNKNGLSTVLAGMCEFDKVVHKNVHQNLDILTAGPIPPNPSQILASDNMVEFINNVKQKYDYVVIDTSPINLVSDSLVIAKNTAGIILVTRQEVTTYDQVEKALSNVANMNINKLGIVVNSTLSNGGKYGKYGYSKYGYAYASYGEEENKK